MKALTIMLIAAVTLFLSACGTTEAPRIAFNPWPEASTDRCTLKGAMKRLDAGAIRLNCKF